MRILFITYFYPPLGGIPPQRSIRLSRKLVQQGVEIIVLTTSNRLGWTNIDETLLEKVKQVPIIRTPSPGTDALYKRRPIFTQGIKLLFIKLLNVLCMDYMFAWNFTLFFKCFSIIKRKRIDFVYNSTPPFSPFLTTALLKIFFPRLKIIGDFRDSFLKYPGIFKKGLWIKNVIRYVFSCIWEKILLKHIDIFFAVSPEILDEMRKKTKNRRGKVFVLLYNGYDEDDWLGLPKYEKSEKFRLTYTGTFPLFRTPRNLLEGYFMALKENDELQKKSEIIFAGKLKDEEIEIIESFPYRKNLKILGEIPYRSSLELQSVSDVNVLILGELEQKGVVTGKIFEYMRASRPILAIVPDGEAKRIIDEGELGFTVDPSNIRGIKNAILNLFQKWKDSTLEIKNRNEFIESFEWGTLAKKFLKTLEESIDKV